MPALSPDAHRILIAADQPAVRTLLVNVLSGQGYELLVARDGLEALTLARRLDLHLVLLEAALPGLDGFTVCQALKAEAVGAPPAVILLSDWHHPEDRERGQAVGAEAVLAAPFPPDALRRLVARVLGGPLPGS